MLFLPSNMYFSLVNGGPAAWFWSYVVVCLGALCQAATFAEMASIQPIAGAQYYWTFNYAPRSMKLFLTWLQGWMTWVSYVALLASCLNGMTTLVEGLINFADVSSGSGGWHTTLFNLAWVSVCAGVNIYAFPLVPWFELLSGVLNMILFILTFVVLWVMSPRNSSSVFLESSVTSGWDSYFVSANVGAVSNIALFICKSESEVPRRAIYFADVWHMFSFRKCDSYGRRDSKCKDCRTQICFLGPRGQYDIGIHHACYLHGM